MIKKSFLFVFLVFMCLVIKAQKINFATIDSINLLAKNLYDDKADSIKFMTNRQVEVLVHGLLKNAGTPPFLFDSLKFIKTINITDGSLRILTWAVPLSQNVFLYSGFLLVYEKNGSVKSFSRLNYEAGGNDLFKSYTADHWPGAVYYKIIEKKARKEAFYTLFGWLGSEPGTASRIIETLYFDENGLPVFGKPVFVISPAVKQYRLKFTFTNRIPFHLAYERQLIPGSKKKKQEMIIFNRLTATKPEMGLPSEIKVPDYAVFDGFIYKDGLWVFVKDIDARMPEQKKDRYKPPANLEISPAPSDKK